MKYFLIDLENVHDRGIDGVDLLDCNCCLVIFYSFSSGSVSNSTYEALLRSVSEVRFQSINVHTKNALDFEIAVYTGQLIMSPDTEKIIIISQDNGYKAVVEAGNQKKQNMMEQHHTLLEAWYASIRKERISVDKGIKGMNDVKKALLEKEEYRKKAAQFSIDPITYENVISTCGNDKRALYLGMVQAFGKKKGLELYRSLKETMVEN